MPFHSCFFFQLERTNSSLQAKNRALLMRNVKRYARFAGFLDALLGLPMTKEAIKVPTYTSTLSSKGNKFLPRNKLGGGCKIRFHLSLPPLYRAFEARKKILQIQCGIRFLYQCYRSTIFTAIRKHPKNNSPIAIEYRLQRSIVTITLGDKRLEFLANCTELIG